MILGYKKSDGREDAYFFGKVPGDDGIPHDRKFIRVFSGLILPHQERQAGAFVVIGELYRPSNTSDPDFTVLFVCVDQWPVVQTAMVQQSRDLKFSHIIADSERSRKQLWRIPELMRVITATAPEIALTEVGRQAVTGLKNEGRYHHEYLKHLLERDPEQGAKAIQCAIMWALEYRAFYIPTKEREAQRPGRFLGYEGLE